MTAIAVPPYTPLPPAASTLDASNFDSKGDTFFGAMPVFGTQMDALAQNAKANADSANADAAIAQTAASAAQIAATQAQGSVGAPLWSALTSYAIGQPAYSPANMRIYRRLTPGTSAGDPSTDGTNWQGVNTDMLVSVVTTTTVACAAGTHYVLAGASAITATMPAILQSGDRISFTTANGRLDNSVNFNGHDHQNVTWATDPTMTINKAYYTVHFKFMNNILEII